MVLTADEIKIRRKMEDDAIRVACWMVLGEDAEGLGQRHIDDLRTLIRAYLWSEESDLVVQKAAHQVLTEHFKSEDHNGDADVDCVDRAGAEAR
jgi:hypothetical protein